MGHIRCRRKADSSRLRRCGMTTPASRADRLLTTIIRYEFPTASAYGNPAGFCGEGRGLTDKSVRPTRYFPRVLVETPAPPALIASALERKRLAGNFPACLFLLPRLAISTW